MVAECLLRHPYRGWLNWAILWPVHTIYIMDVYVVYNDDAVLRRIGGTYTLKVSPFFHFIDDRTREGKKDSWKVKGGFGAKLTPFAVVYEGEKPLKAFYSETGEDVIDSLIKYLNGE